MPEVYLSDRQIGERFGVHHLTPRRWVREDFTFPRPVKLSPGCTRWKLSEIEAWETAKAKDSAKQCEQPIHSIGRRRIMAKRPSHRALRAARSYTFEEAATALGVSKGTIRNWVNTGLPAMKAQRPYLILGEALKDYLKARATNRKAALQPSELYCLSCKASRTPMGMMVDCIPQTASTARLMGLCEACGGTCNRMISRTKIDLFREIFALAEKDGKTA